MKGRLHVCHFGEKHGSHGLLLKTHYSPMHMHLNVCPQGKLPLKEGRELNMNIFL